MKTLPNRHLPAAGSDADWREHAACRPGNPNGHQPDLFFPVGETTEPSLNAIKTAKTACHACPVIQQCGQWALDSGQDHGIWGGMDPRERRAIRRQIVRKDTERREHACRMWTSIRPQHPTTSAAARVVAEALGLHTRTVHKWLIDAGLAPERQFVEPDVRKQAVEAAYAYRRRHGNYGGYREIAAQFGVVPTTVARWVQEHETTGNATAAP